MKKFLSRLCLVALAVGGAEFNAAAAPASSADWERCKQVYGLDDDQARVYRFNPVDNLAPLARAKLPILCVCGDADTVVPMAENTLLRQDRYEKLGGEIKIITKPGVNQHPHSLREPQPIVEFILRHSTRK